MKKTLIVFFAIALFSTSVSLQAQNYKFGHIESQEVVLQMPEYAAAGDSLNTVKRKYDQQAERMQVEINKKYNELIEQQNTLDSLIAESMFAEIQSMQERLQNFQVQANQKLRNLEGALLESVMGKLQVAVDAVAKELDLIYVFDVSARNPMYASSKSIDIGPMVKEKLGIQ